ncbi:MAG: hypothetical protein R3219_08740 [Hydrogenovibrio sp.]|nr:hypothetical protein [Hydrogenovibrio sp.]
MARNAMNTNDKVQSCLEYIDDRLENSSKQTLQIAEMIIDDIKNLSQSYNQAMRTNRLKDHADKVHSTQMKWVNQLHEIIMAQNSRDLNSQVIQALQKFAHNLNQNQFKHLDFDLPPAVMNPNLPKDDYAYLTPEMKAYMTAKSGNGSNSSTTKH